MDGLSVAEASNLLGVSVPRIYRAAAEAGVVRQRGSTMRLSPEIVAGWLRRWGWVPEDLRRHGMTRQEILVLAALSRSPLGLRSARSVARRTSLTPTTAARALASLRDKGLAGTSVERIVEGEVTDIEVWRLNWQSPGWRAIARSIAAVVLPVPAARRRRQRTVPSRFAHLFWNEDTGRLDVERDGVMIAERILRSADAEAIAWAAGAIPAASLRRVRELRNISPRVAALADALAGER